MQRQARFGLGGLLWVKSVLTRRSFALFYFLFLRHFFARDTRWTLSGSNHDNSKKKQTRKMVIQLTIAVTIGIVTSATSHRGPHLFAELPFPLLVDFSRFNFNSPLPLSSKRSQLASKQPVATTDESCYNIEAFPCLRKRKAWVSKIRSKSTGSGNAEPSAR